MPVSTFEPSAPTTKAITASSCSSSATPPAAKWLSDGSASTPSRRASSPSRYRHVRAHWPRSLADRRRRGQHGLGVRHDVRIAHALSCCGARTTTGSSSCWARLGRQVAVRDVVRRSWRPLRWGTVRTRRPPDGATLPGEGLAHACDHRGRRPRQALWRRCRRRRGLLHRRAGRDLRPARPERGREDHDDLDAVVPHRPHRRQRHCRRKTPFAPTHSA